jgi:aspartate/methionine/tyrosine aminotransferase
MIGFRIHYTHCAHTLHNLLIGFRVGWLHADPEVVKVVTKLQEPFISCGVPFCQMAAREALVGGQQVGDCLHYS